MDIFKEKPFERLRKRSGEKYDDRVVRNYYIARRFTLNLLQKIAEDYVFNSNFNKYLHFVLTGADERMLSIARHLALYSHFINFKEEAEGDRPANRTIITIVSASKDLKEILSREEYLCNLPDYCRFIDLDGSVANDDSYLDIEIHLSSEVPAFRPSEIGHLIEKPDVDAFFDSVRDDDDNVFYIDTRKAYYTDQMYNIGATVDNLPYVDIHDSHRYTLALDVCQYAKLKLSPEPMLKQPDEKGNSYEKGKQYELKQMLSNVFCSDCFELRFSALKPSPQKKEEEEDKKGKKKKKDTEKEERAKWEENNQALCVSEHARWVVEKLILGYRSPNADEYRQYERLRLHSDSKDKIKNFKNSLKRNDDILAHFNLCSYRDLRRIDPDNLKYDSFLMLAIPKILQRINEPPCPIEK